MRAAYIIALVASVTFGCLRPHAVVRDAMRSEARIDASVLARSPDAQSRGAVAEAASTDAAGDAAPDVPPGGYRAWERPRTPCIRNIEVDDHAGPVELNAPAVDLGTRTLSRGMRMHFPLALGHRFRKHVDSVPLALGQRSGARGHALACDRRSEALDPVG
jgi:hypothetical protein